jgi:hypothetical protein
MNDKQGFYKTVFLVGAAYDMILGAVFFLAWRPIFDALGVESPGHVSYLHITTAYIFVQGLGYWYVSRNIIRNLDLVRLGIVYKAIYIGLARCLPGSRCSISFSSCFSSRVCGGRRRYRKPGKGRARSSRCEGTAPKRRRRNRSS